MVAVAFSSVLMVAALAFALEVFLTAIDPHAMPFIIPAEYRWTGAFLLFWYRICAAETVMADE